MLYSTYLTSHIRRAQFDNHFQRIMEYFADDACCNPELPTADKGGVRDNHRNVVHSPALPDSISMTNLPWDYVMILSPDSLFFLRYTEKTSSFLVIAAFSRCVIISKTRIPYSAVVPSGWFSLYTGQFPTASSPGPLKCRLPQAKHFSIHNTSESGLKKAAF